MPIDPYFAKGDLVPSIRWLRDFARRVRASAVSAIAPLYTREVQGGTGLELREAPEFDGIVMGSSGAGYTVLEAAFNVATKTFAIVSGGRSVVAYEYNGSPIVEIGAVVRVRYTPVDDWRFFIVRGVANAPPPIACLPCSIPVDAALTLYIRYITYGPPGPTYPACHDDEFTEPMIWDSGEPPPLIQALFGAFKAGYYYTDCIDAYYYGTVETITPPCTYGRTLTYRWYFGCRKSDGRVRLVYTQRDRGLDGTVAICDDPISGTGSIVNFGIDDSTCSPLLSLRRTVYRTDLGLPARLSADYWVYQT